MLNCDPPALAAMRAAGRRWRARAIAALQIPAFTGTIYQSKERPHALGLTRKDLSAVVALTADRLRTRKPSIYAGVAVSAVVAVQNTTPRSASHADALPKCPAAGAGADGLARWHGGAPPFRYSRSIPDRGTFAARDRACKYFFQLG